MQISAKKGQPIHVHKENTSQTAVLLKEMQDKGNTCCH